MDSSYQQVFAHLWDKDEGPLQDEKLGRWEIKEVLLAMNLVVFGINYLTCLLSVVGVAPY